MEEPGSATIDFSLFKTKPILERIKIEFRGEFFNIFNRDNFILPNPVVFSGGKVSGSAGQITSTTTTSRQIEFGMKLIF